jgi:hypothetical protein
LVAAYHGVHKYPPYNDYSLAAFKCADVADRSACQVDSIA